MRLLRYWLCWLALFALAFLIDRNNGLFFLYIAPVAFLFIFLLFCTIWVLGRKWLKPLRYSVRDATTESPLEIALAKALDKEGIPYVREYQISRIHVDFAFPKSKLVVECDGYRYHHDRGKEDAARDAFLRNKGWTVLRFSGTKIRNDLEGCLKIIQNNL
jgi:very-short-patch-repair endonuclease